MFIKPVSSNVTHMAMSLALIVFVVITFSAVSASETRSLSVKEILRKADEARGNRSGISWEVAIVSSEKKRVSNMGFDVNARGFDTLAKSISPPKDKGNKVLMVNGNMWFYKPGLSKAVPISRRQKLIGNAAYGDIASTNYDDDYDATTLADEIINNELCHVFSLKAKTGNATYDQIKYWISKKRNLGVKAEYYTVSGKKFKSADMKYMNRVIVKGKSHPFISEIVIKDAIMVHNATTLKFKRARIGRIPNHIFNRNLLKKK